MSTATGSRSGSRSGSRIESGSRKKSGSRNDDARFQLYHMIYNVPDFLRSILKKLPKIKTRTTQNELRSF